MGFLQGIQSRTWHCCNSAAIRTPLLLGLLVVVCLLPYAGKAFHMDDPLFLWTARQIHAHPLDPFGFHVNWYDTPMPFLEVTKNPPLGSYYLAVAARLTGWGEVPLHFAFLLPAVAAITGTYALAKRLSAPPWAAALATLFTPVFLVQSTGLMCDTMMLALWVWAIRLWILGLDERRGWILVGAVLLVLAAALTKYFALSLLPLLALYTVARPERPWRRAFLLAIPALLVIGYQAWTMAVYGRGAVSEAMTYAFAFSRIQGTAPAPPLWKLLIGLTFTGGCLAPAALISPFLAARRNTFLVFLGALALSALLLWTSRSHWATSAGGEADFIFLGQALLAAVGGCWILWLIGAELARNRSAEGLLLGCWAVGAFLFAAFANWSVNGRSILPMAPAIGILLARRAAFRAQESRVGVPGASGLPRAMPLGLAAAALLSLGVAWADYSLAGSARRAAEHIQKTEVRPGRPMWFQGHWGFQYYMEKAGAEAFDFRAQPSPGAGILVVPENNSNTQNPSETFKMTAVLEVRVLRGLTTMNIPRRAGFYNHQWGALPFAFGAVGRERYFILENVPPSGSD